MNGHARTVYSTLSRWYDFFFPIVYDFVQSLLSFDDDVRSFPMLSQLLLTMVHIFLYVGSWLVNLPTTAPVSVCDCRLQRVMISLVLFQFGCFTFSVEAFKPNVCILVQQYLV